MEIVGTVIQTVVGLIMKPVKKQVGYLAYCRKHVCDMGNKMKELDAKRDDVDKQVTNNKRNLLEVPSIVPVWLEDVGKIKAEVNNFPSDVGSCFNITRRHKIGRKAFKFIDQIDSLINTKIEWIDTPTPLGKVDSVKLSTFTPSSNHNEFKSRESTFLEALKSLEPDHKSHMVAIWGMGGVGKTTMMEKIKTVVKEEKLFDLIVQAVIGEKMDPIAIQRGIADYLSINLSEESKPARAEKLRHSFKEYSKGGKKRILVILDDVWQIVDMNDIGLSPLPDQGVNFKVLLTSRDRHICSMMGVEHSSIFHLKGIEEPEAQRFFCQFVPLSEDVDHDLYHISEDIVRRCYGLPIAIKTMALTLKGKSKDAWENALTSLRHHNIHEVVHKIFEMSYNNLNDEEAQSVLLLCGLFPEDFEIPKEDLVRYGWGLKLFCHVDNISEARKRLNTCVEKLIHTNLLLESQRVGCIKMHDLVREFVLNIFRKDEHATIINHGNMLNWDAKFMSESCQRLSLTCTSMCGFPSGFKYVNLVLLKLMHGDKSTRLPEDFFGGMEKLQVIAYEKTFYPLLPESHQCSTNLTTLCLHECELMFDCSPLGVLLNLEVLSLANCRIRKLLSNIRNLKKLRLLDVTGCVGLRIEHGVLKDLVKLEELYMKVFKDNTINFTDENWIELADRSKNLFALEIEIFKNNVESKNMSFEKLEKFKISIGRLLEITDENMLSSENTLMLATDKGEVMERRLNRLFEKTEVLHLRVTGMNSLEDVALKNSHPLEYYLFYNLRVLVVEECAELKWLFTPRVVKSMPKLEHLKISSCNIMEELICIEQIGSETVKFLNLKFLTLKKLPKLLSLCNKGIVIELPKLMELRLEDLENFTSIYGCNNLATSFVSTALMSDGVLVPNLEKLVIIGMKRLKEIWSGEYSLVNPMPLLHHLKDLQVYDCNSIESLFNIECADEIFVDGGSCNSRLRRIEVYKSRMLRNVWRIKSKCAGNNHNLLTIRGFKAVESIHIYGCPRFQNVFTPTTTNFDLKALTSIDIDGSNYRQEEEVGDHVQADDDYDDDLRLFIPNNYFPQLRNISLDSCKAGEAVFETLISNKDLGTTQQPLLLLPNLHELSLSCLEEMTHVWKCSNFFILKQLPPLSAFHNIVQISLVCCHKIKYLFSPLIAPHFSNLKKIDVRNCGGIEEVVSNRDDEEDEEMATHQASLMFPFLESLNLFRLKSLGHIGGGGSNNTINCNNTTTSSIHYDCLTQHLEHDQVAVSMWSLCQYPKEIRISICDALSSVIPSHAAGHLQSLKSLFIDECDGLREIFTFPTLESLKQLNDLSIENFRNLQVIVKDEKGDDPTTSSNNKLVVFPCLRTLRLVGLPNLNGFFLGVNYDFEWPLLDKVVIDGCPKMTRFTGGHSTSPMLKYIHTNYGKHSVESCGLNFPVITQLEETSLECSTSSCPVLEMNPICSFSNLVKLNTWMIGYEGRKYIIPSMALQQLQKLEEIELIYCLDAEIFEGLNESQSVVKLPKLTQVKLVEVFRLKHIWDNNRWMVVEFPSLTRMSIEDCNGLKHVFNHSMLGSLLQLQELHVHSCKNIEVIMKEVEEEEEAITRVDEAVFPCLKSLTFDKLDFLFREEGFSIPIIRNS